MSRRAFPWSRLGIDPTKDTGAIRKAYADILRATNLDDDIAGYAELRRARDHALWLAAQPDVEEDQVEDEGDLVGLGSLDDDDDIVLGDWDDEDYQWDDSPSARHPDPVSDPSGSGFGPVPELTEAQLRAQAAWNTMLDVLYPDGEPSEEAVTHEQLETGLGALGVLIARAEEADLLEHDALDNALGELFARTWPRSAPFVEPANEAFHWLGEAGALEERYALRFLNDRLKGMRFHEKVQQPGHPLYKAWAELSRPGRAGLVDRLRVRRLDIHRLLTGIRERYPELESLLDAERVRSWENGGGVAEGASNAGRGFGGALLFVVLFFALMRGVAALMGPTGDDDAGKPPLAEVEAALKTAELDIAADRVFGKGFKFADVRAADPKFADELERVILNAGEDKALPVAFVRQRALLMGDKVDFDMLVARAELKQTYMMAGMDKGLCENVMKGDFRNAPLELDKAQGMREVQLLREMLKNKVFSQPAGTGGGSFSVPGWLIEQTIKRSGLSQEAVSRALRNPDDASRCTVEFWLLAAMLKEPGRVPADLLRGL